MRFWQKASQQPWAITQSALTTILDIASRNNETPEIVAEKLGRELNNSYEAKPFEGIMEIPITGPLFRYANLFTLISGATSYERIAKDIKSSLEDDDVGAIVLNIDSPGGEVNGCSELAQLIYHARGTKPIIAYASGDCASGAYWIASACDKIIVADTASLGSIGVVAIIDRKDKDDRSMEFVSSQSPYKRLNIESDQDKQRIQNRVDELAQVFIDRVALHRGVDSSAVETRFGQGDVFIGKHAVSAGLADEVGALDSVIEGISAGRVSLDDASETFSQSLTLQETFMNLDELIEAHPALCQQLEDRGAENARQRIASILSCDAAHLNFPLAQHLALNTTLAEDVIKTTLSVAPNTQKKDSNEGAPEAASTTDFSQVMAALTNPKIVPSANEGDDGDGGESEDVIAKRIAACMT